MLNNYKEKINEAFNDIKNPKTFYKQIPNMLTASRILAPFVIIPISLTGNMIATVVAASLFATTDFFDGLIARKLNIMSELGRELDAVSDKVFALSLIIPLAIQIPSFFINVGLECLIGATNLRAKFKNTNPKTIFIGKVKTFALSTTIILGYLNSFVPLNPIILASAITTTFILQTFTASGYMKINLENEIKQCLENNNIKQENKEEIIEDKINLNKSKNINQTLTNKNINEKQKTLKKTLKKPRI